jgi:hypothetical protein
MRVKDNVYLYDLKTGGFEVRFIEPRPDGPKESRKRFKDRATALAFAATAHALVSTREANLVERTQGRRERLEHKIPEYRAWLLQHGRCKEHANGVANLLERIRTTYNLDFCDQISYSVIASAVAAASHYADRGAKVCVSIKAFLRRMSKKFGVMIDEQTLTFGDDGEVAPRLEPISPGCWSDAQVRTILAALMAPNSAEGIVGIGTGRHSAEAAARRSATLWHHQRLSFVPLFVFLVRYGFRPIDAAKIHIEHYDRTAQAFRLPPKKSNKRRPQVVFLDSLTATLVEQAIHGRFGDDRVFAPVWMRHDKVRGRWTTKMMHHLMRRILSETGLPGTLYWTRHTALTNLCRQSGGDLKLVQRMSGHAQISTLTRYLQVAEDRQSLVAQAFNAKDAGAELAQGPIALELLTALPKDMLAALHPKRPIGLSDRNEKVIQLPAVTKAAENDDDCEGARVPA